MVSRRTPRDTDRYQWLKDVARDYKDSDDDLYQYISAMSKSDQRDVKSQLKRLMSHLVKYMCQPQMRTKSWYTTVLDSVNELEEAVEESPSLFRFLQDQDLQRMYRQSVSYAVREMEVNEYIHPPFQCPWTLDQLFDNEYVITLVRRYCGGAAIY